MKGRVNLLLVDQNTGESRCITQENIIFSWWMEAHLFNSGSMGIYLSSYGRPGSNPTEVFLKYMPGKAFHETIVRSEMTRTEEDISDQRMTRITYHIPNHLETIATQTIRSVGLYAGGYGYKTGVVNKPLTGVVLASPITWSSNVWVYCWYTIEWSVKEAEVGDLTSTRHYMNRLTSPFGGGTSPTYVWRPSSSYCPNRVYWAQDSPFNVATQSLQWKWKWDGYSWLFDNTCLCNYYVTSDIRYLKTPAGFYPSPMNLAGYYLVGKDGSDPAVVLHTNGYKPTVTRVFAHLLEATNSIFFDPIAEDIPEASGFVRVSASELLKDDMFGSPAGIRFNFDSSSGVKVGMAKYNLDVACLEASSTFLADTLPSGIPNTGWRVPTISTINVTNGHNMNQLYISENRKNWIHTAGIIGNLSSYRFIQQDDPSRDSGDILNVVMPGPESSPMTVNTRCITNDLDVFYSKTDRKHKITKVFGSSVENTEMDIVDLDVNFTPILMHLTNSHPADGETDVNYNSFYADFEYNIDPGTIAGSVELLLDGVVVPSTITIDPSNSKRINIVPDETLASDSTYTIRVTADITRKRYTPVSGIHFTGNSYLQGTVVIPYSAITLEFFCKVDEDMVDEQINPSRGEALVYWPYTGRSRYLNLSADGQLNWKSSASEGVISEHLIDSMRFNHFVIVFYYSSSPATNCGIYMNGKQVLSSVNFEYSGMDLVKIGKAIETGVSS